MLLERRSKVVGILFLYRALLNGLKRYVQKEIKYAIDNYDIYPESEISIIPARLDNCQIPFEKLEEKEYVDFFPDWDKAVSQILRSMGIEIGEIKGKAC